MAVFFEFQDSGLDDYRRDKNFLQMGFRPGFAIQARELTQMQTLLQAQFYALAKRVIGESGVIDAPISVTRTSGSAGNPSTFNITMNPGYVLIKPQGKDLGYAVYSDTTRSIDVDTSTGQPFVYLQYQEIQVNPDGDEFPAQHGFAKVEVDPTITDNAQGYYNSSAPGASRYKMEILNLGSYTAGVPQPASVVNIIYFNNHLPYFMNGTAVNIG